VTIDTHHHMLPDCFWQETENAHAPIGGLAPLGGLKRQPCHIAQPTTRKANLTVTRARHESPGSKHANS
jgi:hypothetical protein